MTSDDVLKWLYEIDKTPRINLDGKLFVLAHLSKAKEVKSSDLAISLGASRARITCILNDLEKDMLITRKKTSDDKRITLISLTKKGEDLVNAKINDMKEVIDSVLSDVGEDKFKIYMEVFNSINKNIRRKENETNN